MLEIDGEHKSAACNSINVLLLVLIAATASRQIQFPEMIPILVHSSCSCLKSTQQQRFSHMAWQTNILCRHAAPISYV